MLLEEAYILKIHISTRIRGVLTKKKKGRWTTIEYYEKLLKALEKYFHMDNWKKMFMQGGCYWFANILHHGIPQSHFMINRIEEHCGLLFENGIYDVRGKISSHNFRYATERDIRFMRKNYIPHFDTKALEEYLVKEEILICC